jgi:hypothetical protein
VRAIFTVEVSHGQIYQKLRQKMGAPISFC